MFTQGNYWTSIPEFPSFVPTKLYLSEAGNSLLTTPPPKEDPAASSTYVYDPTNPVKSVGGNNLEIKCGPLDQRPVEQANRTDVLTYTSAVLTQEMALTGPLTMTLYVSSNATDTDFTAKLTDVYPADKGGDSRLIQDGIIRMKWRLMGNDPVPMVPGQVYEVSISMWNTSYIFNKGHSIRVSLSSSNYPRFDTNNNTGAPINVSTAPLLAQNTIYHSAEYPSHLTLPVVQTSQLPSINLAEVLQDATTRYGIDFFDLDEALSEKLANMVEGLKSRGAAADALLR